MKKKIVMFLVMLLFVPMLFIGCYKPEDPSNGNNNPPAQSPTPVAKASVTKVLGGVANCMVDVTNTIAGVSNNVTALDEEESGVASIAEEVKVGDGFREASLGNFLDIQEFPSQIIYTADYLFKNATIENGYANGFELNKTYSSIVTISGMEGVLYFALGEVEGGVTLKADFVFEEGNQEISYSFNGFFGYDYEKDIVKTIEINYIIAPYCNEFNAIKIDFEKNSYYGMFLGQSWTNADEKSLTTTIANKYNSGELTLEDIMAIDLYEFDMCYGNIADNINDYRFDGYCYDSSDVATEHKSSGVLEACYGGVYREVRGLKARDITTEGLKAKDLPLVTFAQDAVSYGQNKGWLSTYKDSETGREYYYFPFLEYDEILPVLMAAKEQMANDATIEKNVKDLLNDAIGYIEHHGESTYVGELGTFNGLKMNMDLTFYLSKAPITRIKISSNNGENFIVIEVNEKLEIQDIKPSMKISWANVLGIINKQVEYYTANEQAMIDDNISDEELDFKRNVLSYFEGYFDDTSIISSTNNEYEYYVLVNDLSEYSHYWGIYFYQKDSGSCLYLCFVQVKEGSSTGVYSHSWITM